MKKDVKIFKALADFHRLRILKALQIKVLCACEIKELIQLASSTVTQHLKVLKDAGFIIEDKEGKWTNYIINPNPEDNRISSILSSLDYWINDKKSLAKDKEIIKKLDRDKLCRL